MNKLKVFTCLKKHVFECSVFLKIWCCNCHWIVSVNDDFSVFIQAGLSVWVLSNCRQHTFFTGKFNLLWLLNSSWRMFWVLPYITMPYQGHCEQKRDLLTPVCDPGGSLMEPLPTFWINHWVQLDVFIGGSATTTLFIMVTLPWFLLPNSFFAFHIQLVGSLTILCCMENCRSHLTSAWQSSG